MEKPLAFRELGLGSRDLLRLATLFPGVPLNQAAKALLIDALDQADEVNSAGGEVQGDDDEEVLDDEDRWSINRKDGS